MVPTARRARAVQPLEKKIAPKLLTVVSVILKESHGCTLEFIRGLWIIHSI